MVMARLRALLLLGTILAVAPLEALSFVRRLLLAFSTVGMVQTMPDTVVSQFDVDRVRGFVGLARYMEDLYHWRIFTQLPAEGAFTLALTLFVASSWQSRWKLAVLSLPILAFASDMAGHLARLRLVRRGFADGWDSAISMLSQILAPGLQIMLLAALVYIATTQPPQRRFVGYLGMASLLLLGGGTVVPLLAMGLAAGFYAVKELFVPAKPGPPRSLQPA